MGDYDRQFEEDLERAQALSLESLALEQFRNKRLQELNRSATSATNNRPKTTSVMRASSMNETDSVQVKYERQLSKSRPRPGTSGGTASNPLIAPPPQSQRRSSGANDVEDLISFASPPATTSSPTSSIIDFCNQQSYANNQVAIIPPATRPPLHQPYQFWPQMPVQQPMYQASIRRQQPAVLYGQRVGNGAYYRPLSCPPVVPSPVVDVSQIGFRPAILHGVTGGGYVKPRNSPTSPPPPALPPKNQHRHPPPLSLHPKANTKPKVSTGLSTDAVDSRGTNSHNLIDLAHVDDKNSVRVSILREFDPILLDTEGTTRTISPDCSGDDTLSVCGSVYDEYYDYDFIYSGSGNNSLSGTNSISDPIYATINRSLESKPVSPTPPAPAQARMSTIDRKTSKYLHKNLLDDIVENDSRTFAKYPDLKAFYNMVYRVRSSFKYNDPDTNMGLVISPMVNYKYSEDLSIKLRVYPDFEGADFHKPQSFTCDVNSSVEHITMQLTYDLDAPTNQNYTLKVWGFNEYLVPTTFLSDYEYVHTCIKLDEDVVLILIPDSKKDKSFARTMQDDKRDKELTFEKVVPSEVVLHITYDSLKILLETLESEMQKLAEAAVQIEKNFNNNQSVMPVLQPLKVIQSIKCIINLMGDLCTLDIIQTIEHLMMLCSEFILTNSLSFSQTIRNCCNKIRFSIQTLIEMYCQAFTVNFEVNNPISSEPTNYVDEIHDSLVLRVCAIYRPCSKWEHDFYCMSAHIYHGTRKIGHTVNTPPFKKLERDKLWPARIIFDYWLDFEEIPISNLARESRLVLQLYGRTLDTSDNSEEDKKNSMPVYKEEELGWAAVQFFDYEGVLIQGSLLLSVWPIEPTHINDHIYGPAPATGVHPQNDHPMVGVEIVAPPGTHFRPVDPELTENVVRGDFRSLHDEMQQLLTDACDQDILYKFPADIRETLWEKRHYLYHMPMALPKVLLAAHSWAHVCLPDLHGMLRNWTKLEPIQALQLLLPVYPDMQVRKTAIKWICRMSNDELVDYLPQLVVALRYETYESSGTAEFLLRRALCSPRFAHYLFWLLSHSLPGSNPQNGGAEAGRDDLSISEVRHHRRIKLLLRALLAVCGESLRKCFLSQQLLAKQLNDVADNLKKSKDSHKLQNLHRDLENVRSYLNDNPTSLPLSPTLKVNGIDVKSCSYFASNTLPLKINFIMEDSSLYPAIYKVGDDLQQDLLTLQMIRLMDKLWLFEGLDLKMVAFNCIPTSKRKGMIELVTKSETLRKIQVEHGLTGSFKDKPIAEWLAKHNPSELEYARAVQNFTASCAGYCVVTYILGICDRHNDNIMLKTSGHLFHIDFGKFLGDAQMFGNFKRDRAPFVLTSDMAYVINGGDRPTEKFHQFVDLCCQAFNIIRNKRNLFLFLMTSSGICSITPESIGYMHRALLPELSNPEAAAYFTRLIEESLKTKFTQFNFFLHNLAQNLAQLKFTADNNSGSLLSFVPKTYSMKTDGRLTLVEVVGYRKRYDPDKYYVYIMRVYRESQNEPMEIQRTYKEFCELHQKLCIYFPLAKLYSLSTGLHMGRQNIKQVAQKRFHEISLFVKSLFLCATEIAHSDLVYTFFHPLLRDQQEDECSRKVKDKLALGEDCGRLKGQLKLTLIYSKGVFTVMVHHARGLPRLNGQEPSTYVKVYLQPDMQKSTKRKTKVVKKNCHPSFMEMLEYRMAIEIVRSRILKATVWNYDPLQENEFMGGVELDLSSLNLTVETSEWYPLINLSR